MTESNVFFLINLIFIKFRTKLYTPENDILSGTGYTTWKT